MSSLSQLPIDGELLSAYIDGDLTEVEKAAVEEAMARDARVAWQVETLRQTVMLLRGLPPVPLPHSFALHEAQVADVLVERRKRAMAPPATPGVPPRSDFWAALRALLNTGNLALRNAAAVAAILFLALWVGDPGRTGLPLSRSDQPQALMAPAEFGEMPVETPRPDTERAAATVVEEPAREEAEQATVTPRVTAVTKTARAMATGAPAAGPTAVEAVTAAGAVAETPPVQALQLPGSVPETASASEAVGENRPAEAASLPGPLSAPLTSAGPAERAAVEKAAPAAAPPLEEPPAAEAMESQAVEPQAVELPAPAAITPATATDAAQEGAALVETVETEAPAEAATAALVAAPAAPAEAVEEQPVPEMGQLQVAEEPVREAGPAWQQTLNAWQIARLSTLLLALALTLLWWRSRTA